MLTDLSFLRNAQSELLRARELNAQMQRQFMRCAADRIVNKGQGRFFDQIEIPVLVQLNTKLLERTSDLKQEFSNN
jgi:hypothetical protein